MTGRTTSATMWITPSSTDVLNISARPIAITSRELTATITAFGSQAVFYFQVAEWDWPICADWCWDCGEDFVVYEDPDHTGWYMLYNVHTGAYVHVSYLGL